MKITEIKTFVVGNPWKNWVFVKVYTDEGLIGVGEATMGLSSVGESQLKELGRFVIGEDPLHPERIWQKLYKGSFLHTNVGMNAIEIACWDILGKSLNAPLWKLLGGMQHPRLRVYANGWYKGPREPGFFAEEAAKLKAMGYTAMKFDPFGIAYRFFDAAEERLSIAIVRAVRKAVGDDVDLCIEGHDRFSVATAIRVGKQLEEFRPMWFETPVMSTDMTGTNEVARAINVPVATGERFNRYPAVPRPAGAARRLHRAAGDAEHRRHRRSAQGLRHRRGRRGLRGAAPGAEPAQHGHQHPHPLHAAQLPDPGVLRRLPGAVGARDHARRAAGEGRLP